MNATRLNLETQTLYLSAPVMAGLVRDHGLVASLHGVADAIREDFVRWRDFEMSARVAHHSPAGVIELMPIADDRLYSFKYVNGHPGNTRLGLSTVMAFGGLADVATGMPLLLSELTLTTALRTAAMSALAAQMLARAGSRTMALVGNGAQAEFQALAFQHLAGIRTLRLYDIDPQATRKLIANLQDSGLALVVCDSAAEAVRGADIVTTITADKTRATILTPDMVTPGMHVNAVGGDCPGKTELHADLLRAARVFVEYAPQTRQEGDIQQLPGDFPVTEIWQVLAGLRPGRMADADLTVFDSVGFALEDFSALRYMHALATARGVGERLSLVPELADPKDLFSMVRPAGPAITACRYHPAAATLSA